MGAMLGSRRPRFLMPGSRDILVFGVVLLLARAVFLLGALDPSQDRVMEILDPAEVAWSRGPERPLYDTEELFTATAAESFRLHIGLPLSAGRFYYHSNGSLLVTLLAVPVFAVLGPSYLAFKIIPLLFTLVGGLCWFMVVRAWWGRPVAWLFGLIYLFAPATFVRTALIAKGDHAEAMAIVGAILLLASKAALAVDPARARRWALAAGCLAGLGVFVSYSTLPVLAGVAVAALLLTRLRPRRLWVALGAGLAAGLVPWVIALVASAGSSLQIYGQSVAASAGVSAAFDRLGILFARGFLAGYDLPGGLAARAIAGHVWGLAVVAGWIALGLRRRPGVGLVLLTATAAHLLAFCLRAPDASSRYLMPVYPLLLAAVTVLGAGGSAEPTRAEPTRAEPARAGERRAIRARRWGLAIIATLCLLGLVGQTAAVVDSRFPALRGPLRGTDWRLLGEVSGKYLRTERVAELPGEIRPDFWLHIGKRSYALEPRDRWSDIASLAGEQAEFVWEGIGLGWMDDRARGMEAGAYAATLAPPERRAFVRGLAHYGEILFGPLAQRLGLPVLGAYLEQFPEDCREPLRLSMARTLATLVTHGHRLSPPGTGGASIPLGSGKAGRSGESDGQVRRLLGEEAMAYGAGYAVYRSRDGRGGRPRTWKPAQGAWTAYEPDDVPPGPVSRSYWAGMAAGFERDLSTLTPQWILAALEPGGRLTIELAALTELLPPEAGPLFCEAAGRIAGRALRDPTVLRSRRGPGPGLPDGLRRAVPAASWEAFGRGLEQGRERRTEQTDEPRGVVR